MAPDSLRERKKATKRHRLMKVALRLFDKQGFDGTTVEEIAAGAEVAPCTFFRYFPRKEDVLFGDHPEEVALIRDTLATPQPTRRSSTRSGERFSQESRKSSPTQRSS
jgi:AcrR family transcriptional regulator